MFQHLAMKKFQNMLKNIYKVYQSMSFLLYNEFVVQDHFLNVL